MPELDAPPSAGKRLPIWAWAVAAGAGLLIGILFLRRGSNTETEDSEVGAPGERAATEASPGAGLSPEILEALGLAPRGGSGAGDSSTASSGAASSSADSGASSSADSSAGDSSADTAPTFSVYEQVATQVLGPRATAENYATQIVPSKASAPAPAPRFAIS